MSHRIIKNGLIGLLNALGYSEASAIASYEGVSEQEYGNTFILKCVDGTQEDDSLVLYDRVHDKQTWQITFAFDRSSQNDIINLDVIQDKKDLILAAMDKPANWTSFARTMRYDNWKLETLDNYFLITLTLKVVDVYTY